MEESFRKKTINNNGIGIEYYISNQSVSYMLGYLSSNLQTAHGIIIVDFPAIHTKSEKGYAEFWRNRIYNGLRLNDYITTHTLEGIESESTYKEFYNDLNRIECPVLVFRGTDSESDIPSNLTEDDIQKYKASVKKLEVIDFEYSGHMIFDEELGKACRHIRRALEKADADEKQPLEE